MLIYRAMLFDDCFIYSTNLIIIYMFLTVEQPKVGYISIDIITETLEGIYDLSTFSLDSLMLFC
jgi:hypothetical protein